MNIPEDCLSYLGITQSCDDQQKPLWTIEIDTDNTEGKRCLAYFDNETRCWKLNKPASGDPEINFRSTWKVATHRPERTSQPQDISWTSTLPASNHVNFFRNFSWDTTSLGPCDSWPHSLRLHTHMLFSDSRPAAIYWGPERTAIYNENIVPLLGELHPALMGNTLERAMPSCWSFFGPQFHSIQEGDLGGASKELELPLTRNGYLEETWWNRDLVTLKDDQGTHAGVYFSWVETTSMTLRDRRTALINRLSQSLFASSNEAWHRIHEVFSDYPRDITMAIMYGTIAEDPEGPLCLKHTIGTTTDYSAAPNSLNRISIDPEHAFSSLLNRSLESTKDFLIIDLSKNDVPAAILENVSWLGFGEPSQYLAVITLRTKELVRGFIVLGLNPRRKLDADHEQFVADIAHHVKRLMLKTISDENTQKREENLTLELSDVERRISRLAEIVPAGIYELSADGSLSWANSHFYDILGVPHDRREFSLFAWPDYILAEDRVRAAEEMGRCLTDAVEITDSLRLRKSYNPPVIGLDFQPKDAPFWIMYSASPDVRPDGSVRSLMGSLTDISHLKWAEQLQITNVEVAQRDRQRNEEFIDITSHEMRNPLSAITQCADSIISSLTDAHDRNDVQSLIDIVKSNIEAAESILFCACHQRRIIDDVLTLGKLDSELLTIAPTAFHPNDLVDQALQMFKTEFDANKIEVQICADENSALANTSVAYADAYRLMQILVNMLTNAIKFTRMQPDRNIQIRSGSSLSAPSADTFGPGFEWYPTQISRPDLTQEADYGEGEIVYLYYAVVDSGKGIEPDFISRVFSKFEQADRRTHTKYGGSGLGLYISRELAELQGGCIGIQSADGAGSTFAFYTKARRSQIATTEESEPATDAHVTSNMAQAFGSLKLAGSGTPTRSPLSTDYNILLVEDNILNQKILAKQLTRVGCVVRVANHGGEAIDYILQMHNLPVEFGTLPSEDQVPYFDCILMDWEMPVCDGLNATTRIREIEAQQDGKRNTIIGITANARTGQIAMATGAGMDSVLPKPFRVAELLSKIRESITR